MCPLICSEFLNFTLHTSNFTLLECFPSLAIWPTYCILLSTFSSVYPDLSDFNLSDSNQEVLYIPGAPAFRSFHSSFLTPHFGGGDEGTRTPGLCLAKAPLSQLSYIPLLQFRIMNYEL